MIGIDDVKKLAELSRLELTLEELEKLRVEIDSIISYIDTIQKVELPRTSEQSPHFEEENVMRADTDPHEPGAYTKELVDQFPSREDNYLKVKKILP